MYLIVGLGNPGKQYAKTRHNIGFMVLDGLQEYYQIEGATPWKLEKKFNAEISECKIGSNKVMLCKPMTYMNASGEAVQLIASFYKIPVSHIIVAHDEKDIPFGEIKIQKDRGHAGHNGIRSLIQMLGSQGFGRIRVGIQGSERQMRDTANFVLSSFTLLERTKLSKIITQTVKEIDTLIR